MNTILRSFFVFLFFLIGNTVALGDHHAVKILEKDGIGKYLADSNGKTLYWFKKDVPGKSACAGPCVDKWPIYYRESVNTPEGITGGDFGTITRDDGKPQTTFRGYPLYYWVNDKETGDTTGHGVNSVWYVVNPGDFPPK